MNWLLKIIDRNDRRVVQKQLIPPGVGLRIGRNSQLCDLVPGVDQGMSRQHFSLVATPQGLQIHDLNSTSGTFVNGRKLVTGSSELITTPAPETIVTIEAGKRFDFEIIYVAAIDDSPEPTPTKKTPTPPILPPPFPSPHPISDVPTGGRDQSVEELASVPVEPPVITKPLPPAPPIPRPPKPPLVDNSGSNTKILPEYSNYKGPIDFGQLDALDESDFADENW